MNEAIYRLADSGGSVRIVIQKKTDGNYIIGISNGRNRPLVCQETMEKANAEFESALPAYLEELKNATTDAKLRAAEEPPTIDDIEEETGKTVSAITVPVAVSSKTEDQPELDFGF